MSTVKPFLFLGTRPEDDAADNEYASVVRCTGPVSYTHLTLPTN